MVNVKERRQSGGISSEKVYRVSSIGTEELGHLEMIGAIVHQLTRNLSREQIMNSGFAPYYVDHTTGIYPTAASGFPWTAASMQSKGDPITDLHENLAADKILDWDNVNSKQTALSIHFILILILFVIALFFIKEYYYICTSVNGGWIWYDALNAEMNQNITIKFKE